MQVLSTAVFEAATQDLRLHAEPHAARRLPPFPCANHRWKLEVFGWTIPAAEGGRGWISLSISQSALPACAASDWKAWAVSSSLGHVTKLSVVCLLRFEALMLVSFSKTEARMSLPRPA